MDGQLAALSVAGLAVGVMAAGSFVARRLGPQAHERWQRFTNNFRITAVRLCLALGAAIFWGALAAMIAKYISQSAFTVEISEDEWLAILSSIALVLFLWLYPKTSRFVS